MTTQDLAALLPASTRGYLRLDTPATDFETLFPDVPESPWRQHPADVLLHYAAGAGMLQAAAEVMLAQPAGAGNEFLLLLNGAASWFDALLQEEAGEYRGYALARLTDNDLYLLALPGGTHAVAPLPVLESVIDVLEGAQGISAAAIAPWLPVDSAEDPGIAFVYGLPALYGEVSTPGSGDASLNTALAISATLGSQRHGIEIAAPNAQVFLERFLPLLPEGYPGSFTAQPDKLVIDLAGVERAALPGLVKSLFIGMNTVDYADAVIHGGNAPWLNFDVGENPNSIFINFEFRDEQARRDFSAEHLPAGFQLAPLQFLEGEAPRYLLVLNIYQSSGGLVEGARAEWSVFVEDPDTTMPRFLVIQAAAESFSADSVNLLTPPEPVSHLQQEDAIASYVGIVDEETEEESTYFTSRIAWPGENPGTARFSREFVVANDYIFWGNAVADRGLYNATVHNRDAVLVAPDEIELTDHSRWASFIRPEPVHTVVYLNPLEIVISPWWNLDEDYLDVTEAYRQELIDFKNAFYPDLVRTAAEVAMRGERPALTTAWTARNIPDYAYGDPAEGGISTTHLHFTLHDPQGLLAALGLAGRYDPVAISYFQGEAPQTYLTLALSQREGDPCGARADWQMVVAAQDGRFATLRLDTLSAGACIDPESLVGLSANVAQQFDITRAIDFPNWNTQVAGVFTRMDVFFQWDSIEQTMVLASQDWVEAFDRQCSLSGVCDENYYDGGILLESMCRMKPELVEVKALATPFDDFIHPQPAEVTVSPPALIGTNAWINVPAYGTQ